MAEHWLNLSEQPTTLVAQAMLGAAVVECIPISATVSESLPTVATEHATQRS